MNTIQSESWKSVTKDEHVRMERTFSFETSESSEYFAEEAGVSIAFSTISIYVEPVFGKPEASVVIECKSDQLSIATASHLAAAFDELYASRKWQAIAA